jgi:hypothetical protein
MEEQLKQLKQDFKKLYKEGVELMPKEEKTALKIKLDTMISEAGNDPLMIEFTKDLFV